MMKWKSLWLHFENWLIKQSRRKLIWQRFKHETQNYFPGYFQMKCSEKGRCFCPYKRILPWTFWYFFQNELYLRFAIRNIEKNGNHDFLSFFFCIIIYIHLFVNCAKLLLIQRYFYWKKWIIFIGKKKNLSFSRKFILRRKH